MATIFEPSFAASSSLRSLDPLFAPSNMSSSSNVLSSTSRTNNNNSSSSIPPLSMADSLPSLTFGFEELRERMARFTVRFDAFIETGRRRVLEERNAFRMNVAEIQEDSRLRSRDIAALHAKSHQHASTLDKEAAETAEMRSAIASLTDTLTQHTATRAALLARISQTQTLIAQKRAAQAQHATALAQQARHDRPELEVWTRHLGLRVEGCGGDDRLRFVFANLDEREWKREGWFVLDCGAREYRVEELGPRVQEERVRALVEAFNEGRELAPLLKGMRELFVEAMRG